MVDFEAFGDSLLPQPVKKMREQEARRAAAKAKRAEIPPMVKRGLELKMEHKQIQMKRYRQWKAEVREGLKRGDYGTEIIGMFRLIRRRITAKEIVAYVLREKWLLECTPFVRVTLLGYLNHALSIWQTRNGWPMDDPVPYIDVEPADFSKLTDDELISRWAFYFMRRHLTGVGHHGTG